MDLPYTCHLIPLSSWAVIAHSTGMNHDERAHFVGAGAQFPADGWTHQRGGDDVEGSGWPFPHGKMLGLKGRSLEHMGKYGEIIGTYGNIWENLWNI